jgi:glutathione S-transferase
MPMMLHLRVGVAQAIRGGGAWRRRIAALPGWKPPYEMMPVGASLPLRAP